MDDKQTIDFIIDNVENDKYNWGRNSTDTPMSAPHRARLRPTQKHWVAETECNCVTHSKDISLQERRYFPIGKKYLAERYLMHFVNEHYHYGDD